jgi:hypothetical protein
MQAELGRKRINTATLKPNNAAIAHIGPLLNLQSW